MKNLTLSQIDLNIEEVDLTDVKGGKSEVIPSGGGKDGRSGNTVEEYLVIVDDDTWFHMYI